MRPSKSPHWAGSAGRPGPRTPRHSKRLHRRLGARKNRPRIARGQSPLWRLKPLPFVAVPRAHSLSHPLLRLGAGMLNRQRLPPFFHLTMEAKLCSHGKHQPPRGARAGFPQWPRYRHSPGSRILRHAPTRRRRPNPKPCPVTTKSPQKAHKDRLFE